MYIYIYVYIYVYMYTYIYTHICISYSEYMALISEHTIVHDTF